MHLLSSYALSLLHSDHFFLSYSLSLSLKLRPFLSLILSLCLLLTTSGTNCGETSPLWQNVKDFWQIFMCNFVFGNIQNPIRQIFMLPGNYSLLKMAKYEKIIQPSGHPATTSLSLTHMILLFSFSHNAHIIPLSLTYALSLSRSLSLSQ